MDFSPFDMALTDPRHPFHAHHMAMALEEAEIAADEDEVPIGAVIVSLERGRIKFAFVWLYGLLVHRTLRLNVIHGYVAPDRVFEEEMIRNFRQLIDRAISHSNSGRTKT